MANDAFYIIPMKVNHIEQSQEKISKIKRWPTIPDPSNGLLYTPSSRQRMTEYFPKNFFCNLVPYLELNAFSSKISSKNTFHEH